jgi:antitoxin (DNA-binding transcriptional repressor) of toxin-antitoxin stability system
MREDRGAKRGFRAQFRSSRVLSQSLDKTHIRLYRDRVKTLTITDAKKNLGRWLAAASRGEDVGIVCGADIIALRKVDVESTDYAQREYGATSEQVTALEKATDRRYRALKRSGKLIIVTAEQLRKMIE